MQLTEERVREMVAGIEKGDMSGMFGHIADDIEWVVVSPERSAAYPLTGTYDKQSFRKSVAPFYACFDAPLKFHIDRIIIGSDGESAVIQSTVNEKAKDGTQFKCKYCWVCDFNAEGKVKRLHSFLDTAMALDVMKANGAA